MLLDLPSDVAASTLSRCSLDDLHALLHSSKGCHLLARSTAASLAWRAQPGHASALRQQMWRRGAAKHRLLGGAGSGATSSPHRHAPLARCVALSAVGHPEAGPLLASADDSGLAVLWRLNRREPAGVASMRHARPLLSLALNPVWLATACDDGAMRLWRVTTAAVTGSAPLPASGAMGLGTSYSYTPAAPACVMLAPPSGVWVGALAWVGPALLLSAGADRTLRLWDVSQYPSVDPSPEEEHSKDGRAGRSTDMCSGGSGPRTALQTEAMDGRVSHDQRLGEVGGGGNSRSERLGVGGGVEGGSGVGAGPASASSDRGIWPLPVHSTRAHSKPIVALAAAGGAAEWAGGGVSGGAVGEAGEGAGSGGGASGLPLRVLSGASDGSVRLWDVEAGLRCAREIDTGPAAVRCLVWETAGSAAAGHGRAGGAGGAGEAVSSSGASSSGHGALTAACGSADGLVRLWDFRLRRECVGTLNPGRGLADTLAMADGALFCAGGGHGGHTHRSVAVWDLRQRRVLTRLAGHVGAVTAVAAVRGGDGIVSADAAGSVRHWSLEHAYGRGGGA
jgi:WD40 repeat protein